MIFLALGSNLSSSFANKYENLNFAISYLKNYEINVINKSHFYETPSYPNANDPKFINMVISVKSSLRPKDLMSVLLLIEEKLERKRNQKNDPRTCDIDIIDYNGEILNIKYENFNLKIPHKDLSSRNFVLFPLREISPNWKHPNTKESINLLIDRLPDKDKKSILMIKKN
tara:strand:- start:377 stop:889 length:513 start_codon:yes stop_codon:yes gene_type:complete